MKIPIHTTQITYGSRGGRSGFGGWPRPDTPGRMPVERRKMPENRDRKIVFWLCAVIGMAIGIALLKRTYDVVLPIFCVFAAMFVGLVLRTR